MRVFDLTIALVALSMFGCSAGTDGRDEGWGPDGKSDDTGVTLKFKSYDILFTG